MTHDDDTRRATIEGLDRLLDVYGADRSRWPARERLRFSAFVAESAEARRRLAEAEALEAVLDRAPDPGEAGLDALKARIMAAAASGAHAQSRTVVPMAPRAKPLRRPSETGELGWSHAALLAASVMLGVFAGNSGLIEDPLQGRPSLETAAQDSDEDASQFVLGSEESGIFDVEDML